MHPRIVLPDVKIPDGYSRRNLTLLSLSQRRKRFVSLSLSEFHGLVASFRKVNSRKSGFLPGAWLGPIELRANGPLPDVIWAGVVPFFSLRLIRTLQSTGVRLSPKPVTVIWKKKHLQSYFYCQPAIVEICSRAFLDRFYDRCQTCGAITQKRGVNVVQASNGREYVKSRWPVAQGIVYSVEHEDMLFSPDFVKVCLCGGFEGLAFESIGRWA